MKSSLPTTSHARKLAAERTISPRDLDLDIPRSIPRYWFGGEAYGTHLMNAFSLVFPPGERFFMDAVRHFRAEVRDPALLAQIRGFCGQEALHSREHKVMNEWLSSFGIDANGIEQRIGAEIAHRRSQRTPMEDLAVTCALEHFTALMAESWLRAPELRALAPEPIRSLWTWHAIEELDHKSVAFDVYRAVGGDERMRLRVMVRITIGFILGISLMHIGMMRKDGTFDRPRDVLRGWFRYWGPRGTFTRQIPAYLRYFRRDFHPWETDSRPLIAAAEREIAAARRAA